MYHDYQLKRAFSEGRLEDQLGQMIREVDSKIKSESDDYILKVDEEQYLKHLVESSILEVPELLTSEKYLTEEERQVPAEQFPNGFYVDRGKSYPKRVYTCHIPFIGDPKLIFMRASTYFMSAMPFVKTAGGEILFDVIDFNSNAETIRSEVESNISQLEQGINFLRQDINKYNSGLPTTVRTTFTQRKDRVLKDKQTATAIGIPIRRRSDAPAVFSVPTVNRKKPLIPQRPAVPAGQFEPHPTMADDVYHDIMKMLLDFTKELERHPEQHQSLDEEELRNLILTFLQPQFEGGATGETFNKNGKTDILVRHQNSNLFVAECKIWKGKAQVPSAINQLLSYLTWRDSKSALIVFVRNKEMGPAITGVHEAMISHPAHRSQLQEGGVIEEYRFELPDANGIFIKISTLLVHLPK